MPVQIQMAQPADLAGDYLRGVQTGNAIRSEKARLQQEQQQEAQRLQLASQQQALRMKQVQQQYDVQQQRIQVAQSYNQQKAALRSRQLDQIAQVNHQKTAAAARQYQVRQMWQNEFSKIDSDTTITDEQKNQAKTSAVMRLAPAMGIAGTEAASMIREMRPPKPTVPATVTDRGDMLQVTQPNGSITFHAKPKPEKEPPVKDSNVKVALDNSGQLVTMPKSQALQVIPGLPKELQTNAVNKAVLTTSQPAKGKPAAPKAGDVYKGHKFKGGDPAKAENWEKVGDNE